MEDRYHPVARALHWIIAILILFNLWLGFGGASLPREWPVMPVHKSIGLTILALTILRIIWRLAHRPPPLPAHMPTWEKAAAKATHFAFYALLLLTPMSGWIMSSAGGRPLNWFFLFDVPKFPVAKGDAIVALSSGGHEIAGFLWAALILMHVAAALRHHFILKDGLLRRMWV